MYSLPVFFVASVLVLIFVYAVKKCVKPRRAETATPAPVVVAVPAPAPIPVTTTLPTVYCHVNHSEGYIPPTAPPSYDTVYGQPAYKVEFGSPYPHIQPNPYSQPYPQNESYPQNQRTAY